MSYNIYPDTIQKLESAGISDKIDKYIESEGGYISWIYSHVSQQEIFNAVSELQKQDFYKYIPKDFMHKYKQKMQMTIDDPKTAKLIVEKKDGNVDIPLENKELLLFTGDYASLVLKSEDLAQYKEFGFSSPASLMASTGALMYKKGSLSQNRTYSWESVRDGIQTVNEFRKDLHSDFRFYQTDVTPYVTKDFLDNKIGFRPITHIDESGIIGYHSVEGGILTTILKYIDQQNLKTIDSKEKATLLVNSISKNKGSIETATGFGDSHPSNFFWAYGFPLPVLDENNKWETPVFDHIHMEYGGTYGAYISSTGNLVRGREGEEGKPVKIVAEFFPDDIENLLKGLLYQAANHMGRTSIHQLISILDFRYSSDFDKRVKIE